MKKTILVTGGAGYLGCILCKTLLEKGYKVRIFDKLFYGKDVLSEVLKNPDCELVVGDVTNIERYDKLFDNIYAVLHLAALSNDPSCDLDPEMTEKINIEGTKKTAILAKQHGVKRFVFASSCSVYGAGDQILDESSQLKPISLYAKSKMITEKDLTELMDDNFCVVLLRQATLFGYSPRQRFDLAINLMVKTALTKKQLYIVGGGEQWRPFLHLKDSSEAFILAMEAPSELVNGHVFNVGSNENNYQIVALANLIKAELAKLKHDVDIIIVPSDPDKRTYNVNFDKIQSVLGFKARFNAIDGTKEIAEAILSKQLDDLDNSRYYNIRNVQEWVDLPAIEGGEPSRWTFLPFALPLLGEEEENEVIDTLRSGWLTTGPKTQRFEKMVADYLGVKHAIALSSCTGALHLSLLALNIGKGDEVITTPITFAATANVIEHVGAKPVFVDVDPHTLNIDANLIEAKITEKTKAIIPVHMAGQPCDMTKIRKISIKHNIPVIEDAAHAYGAEYGGKKIGTISDATCYSFYPIKNITTIEGGVLATNNDELAAKARILALHGMSKDAWKRYLPDSKDTGSSKETIKDSIHWMIVDCGWKYNMTDVQASVGIHQLKKIDRFIEIRERYCSMYDLGLKDLDAIKLPEAIRGIKHARHLYIIQVIPEKLKISRDELVLALRKENIGTGIHFLSVPNHPYYANKYGYKPGDFPMASKVADNIISLPLYPKMTEEDIHRVIAAVKKIVRHYKK